MINGISRVGKNPDLNLPIPTKIPVGLTVGSQNS